MNEIIQSNRKTERLLGVFFLTVILAYGIGNGLINAVLNKPDYLAHVSENRLQLTVGACLMLVNSVIVAAIGVLMLPILKQYNKNIAYGYFISRLVESIVLIVGVIFLLLQLTISQEYLIEKTPDTSYFQTISILCIKGNFFAYQIAMIALGLGSLPFCYLLYQSKLLPKIAAIWGIIGYAIFLTGAVLEIFGFSVGTMLSIPGGLFEIFLGIWLIVKGFNSPTVVSETE
jgi:hypothetical protein